MNVHLKEEVEKFQYDNYRMQVHEHARCMDYSFVHRLAEYKSLYVCVI